MLIFFGFFNGGGGVNFFKNPNLHKFFEKK